MELRDIAEKREPDAGFKATLLRQPAVRASALSLALVAVVSGCGGADATVHDGGVVMDAVVPPDAERVCDWAPDANVCEPIVPESRELPNLVGGGDDESRRIAELGGITGAWMATDDGDATVVSITGADDSWTVRLLAPSFRFAAIPNGTVVRVTLTWWGQPEYVVRVSDDVLLAAFIVTRVFPRTNPFPLDPRVPLTLRSADAYNCPTYSGLGLSCGFSYRQRLLVIDGSDTPPLIAGQETTVTIGGETYTLLVRSLQSQMDPLGPCDCGAGSGDTLFFDLYLRPR